MEEGKDLQTNITRWIWNDPKDLPDTRRVAHFHDPGEDRRRGEIHREQIGQVDHQAEPRLKVCQLASDFFGATPGIIPGNVPRITEVQGITG